MFQSYVCLTTHNMHQSLLVSNNEPSIDLWLVRTCYS